jgi:ribosomal protein L24
MMVRLNKNDLQSVLVWGLSYVEKCKELRLPFEEEEVIILKKLGKARDKACGYEKGLFEKNHEIEFSKVFCRSKKASRNPESFPISKWKGRKATVSFKKKKEASK